MIKPKVDCMAGQNRDIIKQYPPYKYGRDICCMLNQQGKEEVLTHE